MRPICDENVPATVQSQEIGRERGCCCWPAIARGRRGTVPRDGDDIPRGFHHFTHAIVTEVCNIDIACSVNGDPFRRPEARGGCRPAISTEPIRSIPGHRRDDTRRFENLANSTTALRNEQIPRSVQR